MNDCYKGNKKEKWVEIKNCSIDFSKLKPFCTSDSLHISEERYYVNDIEYRLLYEIGSDIEKAIVEMKK
jgi:hypothetical protein